MLGAMVAPTVLRLLGAHLFGILLLDEFLQFGVYGAVEICRCKWILRDQQESIAYSRAGRNP